MNGIRFVRAIAYNSTGIRSDFPKFQSFKLHEVYAEIGTSLLDLLESCAV